MLTVLADPSGPLSYVIILLLIILSACFSGCEVAFNYCNRYKIKVWADDGNKRAKVALRILEKLDNTVISILIGNNIVNTASSILATMLAVSLVGPSYGSIVSIVIMTVITFIFGEILPKNIAQANCNKWVIWFAYPLYALIMLFTPFVWLFNGIVFCVKKILRIKDNDGETFTDDDFQDVVEKISDEGGIEEDESEIIIAAVDWGDMVVSEVLTKRQNMVALNIKDCTDEYLKEFLKNNTYSRYPVYEGTLNNIIGILHVRVYLKELYNNKKVNIRSILLKPYIVSPKIKLDDIFEGFKEHKTHIAIVQEKNRTIGMVTMKDILEELVSDIDEAGTSINEGGAANA